MGDIFSVFFCFSQSLGSPAAAVCSLTFLVPVSSVVERSDSCGIGTDFVHPQPGDGLRLKDVVSSPWFLECRLRIVSARPVCRGECLERRLLV